MNERIKELAKQANAWYPTGYPSGEGGDAAWQNLVIFEKEDLQKFAELIVKEMCGMMEQAEDDCYHCFEPSERPTEYISWLNEWRTRFEQHFGVEE
jgi:hypothetical protein